MPSRPGCCQHRRCLFVFNSRFKHQRYCGSRECQRVIKEHWRREYNTIRPYSSLNDR